MDAKLVEKLRSLNTVANGGRGSNTVKTILSEIDRGDSKSAEATWDWDGDKLHQYPELHITVIELLGCRSHHAHNCENWLCAELKKDVEKKVKAVK